MITIQGKYNNAVAFTDEVEPSALEQITLLLDQPFISGSKVRIMPDVHAGKGCTIGTTMTLHGRVVPDLVGVDIGCGMLFIPLGEADIHLPGLDGFIREHIPSGFNVHKSAKASMTEEINSLRCLRELKGDAAIFNRALGTLGGGNHFIEVAVGRQGCKWLIIHSGSRNLGKQVADHYQKRAVSWHSGMDETYEEQKARLIAEYKAAGRRKEIQGALAEYIRSRRKDPGMPEDLCYLEGSLFEDYIHDMRVMQAYAAKNRRTMAEIILHGCLHLQDFEAHETVHNYIDLESMVLRKGAVSAKAGETLLIPMNMRDGSLLCRGKGNAEWNCSAPHGAGRIYSRAKARETLSMEAFQSSMDGIYTTSVCRDTLDESPMAYKPMEAILAHIRDTVEVVDVLKPVYNFKAAGD